MASRFHLSIMLFLLVITITSTSSLPIMNHREKLSHLHFYFHDIISNRNPTVVEVIKPASAVAGSTKTLFGAIRVMDDPLTEGPDPNSPQVGRAQGIYSGASQEEMGFLQVMNLAFTSGKHNGSVISVMGRNIPLHPVRELPIVGGSGLYRGARGYVLLRTTFFNPTTNEATVEYNVTVLHF